MRILVFSLFLPCFLVEYHSESVHTMASCNGDHDESFSGPSGSRESIKRSMFYDCGLELGE